MQDLTILTTGNLGSQTRTYRNGDWVLQALAFSDDGFCDSINYYCLAGIWEPQCDTQIVSSKKLASMYQEAMQRSFDVGWLAIDWIKKANVTLPTNREKSRWDNIELCGNLNQAPRETVLGRN